MTFGRVLADGATACVPFTLVVWVTFVLKPRVWLHSLPVDIQAMAPPKTAAERHATVWLGAVVLFCFFGVPSVMTWRLHSQTPGGLSLREAIVHLYAVWMIVNVWDLLAIDWPVRLLC